MFLVFFFISYFNINFLFSIYTIFISLQVIVIFNPHIDCSALVVFSTHSNFQPTIIGVQGVLSHRVQSDFTTSNLARPSSMKGL